MNQNFIQNALAMVMPAAINTGLFVSLFTAMEPVPTIGPTGAVAFDYTPVAGLTDIVCIASSQSPSSIQATEVRALEEITASELHTVLLPAYYPQLDDGWRGENSDSKGAWVCQIQWKGVWNYYEIQGVGSDSQSQGTWVKVKLATA